MKKRIGLFVLVVGLLSARSIINMFSVGNYEISGGTMGTFYKVKIVGEKISEDELRALKVKVNRALDEVNRQMSTYKPDSEISTFNKSAVDVPMKISEGFSSVVDRALKMSSLTQGAFDPTVSPLIDIWGFGSKKKSQDVPSDLAVKVALSKCGYKNISLKDRSLTKTIDGLQLNLGAIAKGYGVDMVAKLIKNENYSNYMVEIGGEIVTAGLNPNGEAWKIGVQKPQADAALGQASLVLNVADRAVATSGDYRNFFEYKGEIYSHVIDPTTGFPTKSNVASVTVMADDCVMADGLATALMVMGPDKGLPVVESLPGIEALFFVRQKDGTFKEYKSSKLSDFVVK